MGFSYSHKLLVMYTQLYNDSSFFLYCLSLTYFVALTQKCQKCIYLFLYCHPIYIYIYIFFFFFFFFFWLCWIFVAAHGLSVVALSEGYSSLRCAGFSLQWLLLLRSTGFRRVGFSSCGTRAQLLRGMWDLPGPGIEPMSPALAGGFLTTAPPGKSHPIYS